jgi:hypothetical protein
MRTNRACDDTLNWCPYCGDPRIVCDASGGHKDEDFLHDELWDDDFPECEICGCTEYDACPGGCAWSYYFSGRDRAVCTSCEIIAIFLEVNMGALQLFRAWQLREVRAWQP